MSETKVVFENEASTGSTITADLIANVNGIVHDSNDEPSHLEADAGEAEVKPYNRAEHLEIITVKKGDNKIRILSPALRSFLYFNTETEIVSAGVLENDGEPEAHKRVKRMHATYPINRFAPHLSNLKAVEESDFEYGVTKDLWNDFVGIVQNDYDVNSAEAVRALEAGLFTFQHLAIGLGNIKGLVSVMIDEKLVAGKIKTAQVKSSFFGGTYLAVEMNIYVHTGRQLISSVHTTNIPLYRGEKTASELGLYILENHPDVKAKLVERGTKYLELTSKPSYMQSNGVVTRRSYYGSRHYKAKGRVMIDNANMRRVDPNYDFYFGIDRYNDSIDKADNRVNDITDDVRACTPPFVYGFSFTSKAWGEMDIDTISNIDFRTDAYDKLVLDPETKRVIFSLVDTDYSENSDLISGKGGGCIFLLAGPPGVGKTLTSEAISERLKRPLYMVSVGELGTDVDSLENSLREILDTAAAWNAVLLIDEADIFLEQRTPDDIERNAMVGVFLRLLEYYEGILFLTTNRASNIDTAFFSRISVAIHYDDLKANDRRGIWRNLLQNSKITTSLADSLFVHPMNGRQIKNAIRNANALAKADGRVVDERDFRTVIGIGQKFEDHMQAQREAAKPKAVKAPNFIQRLKTFFFGD